MTDATTLSRVRALVGDALGKPAADVPTDKPFTELGMDSLDVVKLSIDIEDHFDIDIVEDEEISAASTVEQLATKVEGVVARPPVEMVEF